MLLKSGKCDSRKGIVAPLVAVSLIALMGVCALVLDLGIMQDRKRHLQGAADAAALAAAIDFFINFQSSYGSEKSQAQASAVEVAKRNGYVDGGVITVTVNIPPNSGQFKDDKNGYTEVIITYKEARRFSAIFGSDPVPVTARAVSRGAYSPFSDGILILDPSAKGALTVGGSNATLNVTGTAAVVVDSSDPNAGTRNGGSTIYSQSGYDITGNVNDPAGFTGGTLLPGVAPTPDPFASRPQPDATTLSLPKGNITSVKDPVTKVTTFTLAPGVYGNGAGQQKIPNFTGSDNVVFLPGIYILSSGGFNFSSSGYLLADDVLIYDGGTGSNDAINITGQPGAANVPGTSNQVIMTPYGIGYTSNTGSTFTDAQALTFTDASGVLHTPGFTTYAGFSIWANRTPDKGSGNNFGAPISVTGNGTFDMTGLFYAANSIMKVAGNGDVRIGAQYISRQLQVQGNGSFTVDYNSKVLPKFRVIDLVE